MIRFVVAVVVAVGAVGCGTRAGHPIVAGAADGTGDTGPGATSAPATTSTSTSTTTPTTSAAGSTGEAPFLIALEAELGVVTPVVEVFDDPEASGGAFVMVPGGGGRHDGGTALTVTVPRSGDYDVWGRVLSPSAGRDSFRLYVDGAAERDPWHTGTNEEWDWINASTLTLDAGEHVIEFRAREAGAQLDIVVIADVAVDPDFDVP